MELQLKDRIAFVTGASRGIGYAIAEALAKEGVHLRCSDATKHYAPNWPISYAIAIKGFALSPLNSISNIRKQ